MKKSLFKYSQQIIVVLVIASASVGIVFAATSFNVGTLVAGFLRKVDNGHDDPNSTHPGQVFYYGYGFSGNLQDWGYGYGYDEYYGLDNGIDPELTAEYGFDGEEGPAEIEMISSTATTITVDYSTEYLARESVCIDGECSEYEDDFTSGERQYVFEGLTCGIQYDIDIETLDAGANEWSSGTAKYSTATCSGRTVTGIVPGSPLSHQNSNSTSHNPRGLRLPPITLALGSLGADVQDLQILLNFFGTFLASDGAGSPGAETQTFGTRTKAALMKFQSTFGLGADGIYGQKTHDTMESFLK